MYTVYCPVVTLVSVRVYCIARRFQHVTRPLCALVNKRQLKPQFTARSPAEPIRINGITLGGEMVPLFELFHIRSPLAHLDRLLCSPWSQQSGLSSSSCALVHVGARRELAMTSPRGSNGSECDLSV